MEGTLLPQGVEVVVGHQVHLRLMYEAAAPPPDGVHPSLVRRETQGSEVESVGTGKQIIINLLC